MSFEAVFHNPLVGVMDIGERVRVDIEDRRVHLQDQMWDWLLAPRGRPRRGLELALRDAGVSASDIAKYADPMEPRTRLGSQEIQRRAMEQLRYASPDQIVHYYKANQR